jgi:hypothetical protein
LVGQVPATTTYGEWFKTQTTEFQDQVLGSTRGEMFRNGGISLDKFTARDGDVLTLDELKRKGLGSFGSPSQSVLGFNNPTTIVEKGVSFSTNPIPRMWTNRLPKTYKDSVNIDLADRDRLLDITLASNIKESVVKSIPLSKIRTYQGLVERERVNAMALDFSLAEYKKKGRAVLFQLPDGSYLLHDGNHRVGAAMSSGLKDLEFEVRKLVKSK